MPITKPGKTLGTPVKADMIRTQLKNKGQTVAGFAREINYSRQAVQGALAKGRMSKTMIALVAEALHKRPEDILAGGAQ